MFLGNHLPEDYAAIALSAPIKDIASSKVKADFSPIDFYIGD
jgi:hypothetical protein